jgi:hypothetical protein
MQWEEKVEDALETLVFPLALALQHFNNWNGEVSRKRSHSARLDYHLQYQKIG